MNRRRSDRRAALLAAFALIAAPVAVVAASFKYLEDEIAHTVNPLHEATMAETRLNELLFEGLYGPAANEVPEPRLAESGEVVAGGRGIIVSLRPGLAWSDGQPLTAQDVAFTVKAFQDPGSDSPDRGRLSFVKSVEVLNSRQVRLDFTHVIPDPREHLYFKILPAHAFGGKTAVPRDNPFWQKPVTSGPFAVAQRQEGSWKLAANGKATRAPAIKEVSSIERPDKSTQVWAVENESAHGIVQVTPEAAARLQASRCCRLEEYPVRAWWYLAFNTRNSPLNERGVREAVARGIDQAEVLKAVGGGDLITGPFVASSKYYNTAVQPLAFDRAGAGKRLEALGFRKQGKYYAKGNRPLELRLFYHGALGEAGKLAAYAIQGQLLEAGLKVQDPVLVEGSNWRTRVLQERQFDLVLSSWNFGPGEDIRELFHSAGALNFTGWGDAYTDNLLDQTRRASDPAQQQAYYRDIHKHLAEAQPYVFLWTPTVNSALRREVRNVYVQAFYYFTQFPKWQM
ncbi:ABC transporter substrate-binding protein [Myxococcota bacterium]|nr:ABC transporter substrate-binding protein [Myxococcota bacterium]